MSARKLLLLRSSAGTKTPRIELPHALRARVLNLEVEVRSHSIVVVVGLSLALALLRIGVACVWFRVLFVLLVLFALGCGHLFLELLLLVGDVVVVGERKDKVVLFLI